ncbi:MAG: hypothetical protein WCP35_07300 [Verrucomicrobiota bacterium]
MATLNLDSFDSVLEFADNSSTVLQRISGSQAFRKYNWLLNSPARNTFGNFRGMVVSGNAKTVFIFVSKVGDVASNLGAFSLLVAELKTMNRNIVNTASSNSSQADMTSRISAEVSVLCSRVAMKVKLGLASILASVLTANRYLNPICSLNTQGIADAAAADLKTWLTRMNTKIDEVVTGENYYRWVTIYLNE